MTTDQDMAERGYPSTARVPLRLGPFAPAAQNRRRFTPLEEYRRGLGAVPVRPGNDEEDDGA